MPHIEVADHRLNSTLKVYVATGKVVESGEQGTERECLPQRG